MTTKWVWVSEWVCVRVCSVLQINHIYPGVWQDTRTACGKQFMVKQCWPGQCHWIGKGYDLWPPQSVISYKWKTKKTLLQPRQRFANRGIGTPPSSTSLRLWRPHFEGMNRAEHWLATTPQALASFISAAWIPLSSEVSPRWSPSTSVQGSRKRTYGNRI